jgi:hypothetical protein
MANVITIQQAGTTVVNTPVEANYIVIDGALEVAAGGVITGDPFAPGMGATVEVRGGTLILNGGTITSHPASNPAFRAAVLVKSGQVFVNHGSVIASGDTDAVLVDDVGATVNVSGGQIIGGGGANFGRAGIALGDNSSSNTITISGGLISGGTGGSSGGAGLSLTSSVHALNVVLMSGGSVLGGGTGNSAGNGVWIIDGAHFSMTGGNVSSPGTAALRVNQSRANALFEVMISGGTIIGAGMFASSFTMDIFHSVTAGTVAGGQFTGQWLLASGVVFVQGTQLASANGMLTGKLASGDAINVPLYVQDGAQLELR